MISPAFPHIICGREASSRIGRRTPVLRREHLTARNVSPQVSPLPLKMCDRATTTVLPLYVPSSPSSCYSEEILFPAARFPPRQSPSVRPSVRPSVVFPCPSYSSRQEKWNAAKSCGDDGKVKLEGTLPGIFYFPRESPSRPLLRVSH